MRRKEGQREGKRRMEKEVKKGARRECRQSEGYRWLKLTMGNRKERGIEGGRRQGRWENVKRGKRREGKNGKVRGRPNLLFISQQLAIVILLSLRLLQEL